MNSEEMSFYLRRQLVQMNLYRLSSIVFKSSHTATILCYHSLSEKGNRYAVALSRFKEQIEAIRVIADIVPLADVIAHRERRSRRSVVAITIDDGYQNVLAIAEYLKQQSIPVTLFALATPENAHRQSLDSGELMTYSDLRYLVKQGWTIGSHSLTHRNLTKLSDKELNEEVSHSKKLLEEKIGIPIHYFAYPNGYVNNRVIRSVKRAGYIAACSILPGTIQRNTNQWLLPRTVINKDDKLELDPKLYLAGPRLLGNVIDSIPFWER